MSEAFSVRVMTAADLDRAIAWAAEEGWNPGLADRDPFLAADGEGFLMGFLGEEPVTALSVVRYGSSFGFLGFYICRPEHRGKGFGWRTWQAGAERFAGRTIGLDGVPAQQENYRRSGFELAHRNIRFSGTPAISKIDDPQLQHVRVEFEADVANFDRNYFPARRGPFLSRWLDGRGGRRAIALVEDGSIEGYGVIRPAVSGFKIGPLFARGEDRADRLFRALAAEADGGTVSIDPPESNAAAIRLAERYALTPAFETARMYRGPTPQLPMPGIYGITSFELG